MEKAIDGVFDDFEALCQTLRTMKEEGDALATGLLNQIANITFLSTVYMLHAVLPALAHLSKAFQEGNVSLAAITLAIKYTVDTLQDVAATDKPLRELQKDLGDGGRLSTCELPALTGFHEQSLTSLTQKNITALKENINSRFEDSLPVLTAFRIFDPTAVPGRSDPAFKDYGADDIEILAGYFYNGHHSQAEMKEELLCEWQKFKYNLLQMKDQIPSEMLHPPHKKELVTKSPTEWTLEKMLSMRVTFQHFVPGLLYLAKLCLSLPVSNAWPERGASAVKRLKTRMRSRLKNDMLGAIMHITLNGPEVEKSDQLIKATVKEWMKIKPRRKIAKGKAAAGRATFSDAAVQADLNPQIAPTLQPTNSEDEVNTEQEIKVLQEEVNAALKEMNLPQPDSFSDSSDDSDYDSDFDDTNEVDF